MPRPTALARRRRWVRRCRSWASSRPRPAHDALGDAYHTALICSRLRLAEGIDAYEKAAKEHENGFHGAELPGCVARHVSHGYADKAQALAAMAQEESVCPVCGGAMTCGKWYPQPGKRLWQWRRVNRTGNFSCACVSRRTRTDASRQSAGLQPGQQRQRRATAV